jgi:hypothetical protein
MSVTSAHPPEIQLPDHVDVDVLVLPREVSESGRGLYDDSVVTLAKELRLHDVTAAYQHGAEDRQWIGERAADVIVLSFVIGVASSAGWEALKRLFSTRYDKNRVKGKLARYTQTSDHATWEWFEVEGSGEEVARALDELGPPARPPGLSP